MATKYRFKRPVPPHAKGDPVPDGYAPGVLKTMLAYGRIEAVPDVGTPDEKSIDAPPADKAMRPARVKRKGVA